MPLRHSNVSLRETASFFATELVVCEAELVVLLLVVLVLVLLLVQAAAVKPKTEMAIYVRIFIIILQKIKRLIKYKSLYC